MNVFRKSITISLLFIATAVAMLALFFWKPQPFDQRSPEPPGRSAPTVTPAAGSGTVLTWSEKLGAEGVEAEEEVRIVRELISQFTLYIKEPYRPPLGINEDIVKALTGNNKRKLVLIPANHPSIDERGRLLDRWGTPYHIHTRAADAFDVRSAGPDRILFTPDDLVAVGP